MGFLCLQAANKSATEAGGILQASDIISMPDCWGYPWFAAWDLAYQCIVLPHLDIDFAKTNGIAVE